MNKTYYLFLSSDSIHVSVTVNDNLKMVSIFTELNSLKDLVCVNELSFFFSVVKV